MGSNKPWRKVLYEKQNYDDSYYDEKLLEWLNPRKPDRRIGYGRLVLATSEVTFTGVIFIIYTILFFQMKNDTIHENILIFILVFLTISGMGLFLIFEKR